MTGQGRAVGVLRRGVLRMVPAGRRDWVEAVWAEAAEVPPGPRRLAWRAGGVQLMAREALMRRTTGTAALFAAAAGLAAWAAWPGYLDAWDHRAAVIAMVVVLAGLPLLTLRLFGPAGRSRAARSLRICTYGAVLALMPARDVIDQVTDVRPHAGTDLQVYQLLRPAGFSTPWRGGIVFVVIMALYAGAILWLTSQRSRIAPSTLVTGTGAGIALGLVVYAVAPLGLSQEATNPWLPGSDVDPLVLLAWALVFLAPVAGCYAAERRFTASGSERRPDTAVARQILAAGILTSLVGALLVAVLGTGTTALMLRAPWLRTWLYHGQRQFYGIADLRFLLHGDQSAIAYSHQLTAAMDAGIFFVMFIAFPLLALLLTGLAAASAMGPAITGPGGNPPRGGGGPPGPPAVPDGPGGSELPVVTSDTVGSAAALLGLAEAAESVEHDLLTVG
ncbi:MAG TPA: hypothetical protein VEL03_19090 [Streptosporangiaceae bacterium]|nr:hypothetical protein [Streptosporangiaceae bacterium]